jgi:hypothetical protein
MPIAVLKTPEEVIVAALESRGVACSVSGVVGGAVAEALGLALRDLSQLGATFVVHSPAPGRLEWRCHRATRPPDPNRALPG